MMQVDKNNSSTMVRQFGNPLLQALLLLVFLGLLIWFVLLPKRQLITVAKQELAGITLQQQTLKADSEALTLLVTKLQNSDKEIKLLDEALPLDNRATSSSLMIEGYANSSGMSISQIAIANIDKKVTAANSTLSKSTFSGARQLVTQEAQVVLTGSIDQFTNFLRLLETSGRLLDVTELDITSGEPINFKVKLNTYEYSGAGPTSPTPIPAL